MVTRDISVVRVQQWECSSECSSNGLKEGVKGGEKLHLISIRGSDRKHLPPLHPFHCTAQGQGYDDLERVERVEESESSSVEIGKGLHSTRTGLRWPGRMISNVFAYSKALSNFFRWAVRSASLSVSVSSYAKGGILVQWCVLGYERCDQRHWGHQWVHRQTAALLPIPQDMLDDETPT